MEKRLLLFLAVLISLTVMFTFLGLNASAATINSNQTGTDGLWYTFWTDGGGSVSMGLNGGGNYTVNWNNCGNFVCGKGWSTGSGRTISWTGSSSGAQFVGIYGWLQNPLVEYYIPRSGGSTTVGTYQADGTTWTLTTADRINQPSIEGTATFKQYFGSGGGGQNHNMSQHLSGWQSLGMSVGNHNYQVVATEGWGGSSGSSNITVSEGTSTTTQPTNQPTTQLTTQPTSVPSSIDVSATLTVVNEWDTGGQAKIVITNNGSTATSGWSATVNVPGMITNIWNAVGSGSGNVTISNVSWNAILQPGASTEAGVVYSK
jgi:endo-1,4-beta-xylanase